MQITRHLKPETLCSLVADLMIAGLSKDDVEALFMREAIRELEAAVGKQRAKAMIQAARTRQEAAK